MVGGIQWPWTLLDIVYISKSIAVDTCPELQVLLEIQYRGFPAMFCVCTGVYSWLLTDNMDYNAMSFWQPCSSVVLLGLKVDIPYQI